MKRTALLLIVFILLFPLTGADGVWVFEPIFTRLPDDTLIPPERDYSIPFKGMEELQFIDDYMVRVLAEGEIFRAFYEYVPGEADNMVLELSFRNGGNLTVQTAPVTLMGEVGRSPADNTRLFHYRLPEGFFLPPGEEHDDEAGMESEVSGEFMEEKSIPEESMTVDSNTAEGVMEEEAEDIPVWNICGYLRKKQDYMQKTGIEKK